eukprot:TRINITY_DN944_c0_g1_i1.p1 TRINITY_DN944_c0_g1~~TRINITY_DN944_c0_g1_i1.p1  ORF type:complete len:245 (+),score=47.51 TRINITY_DN944_c0_g1_i1:159-893(+)
MDLKRLHEILDQEIGSLRRDSTTRTTLDTRTEGRRGFDSTNYSRPTRKTSEGHWLGGSKTLSEGVRFSNLSNDIYALHTRLERLEEQLNTLLSQEDRIRQPIHEKSKTVSPESQGQLQMTAKSSLNSMQSAELIALEEKVARLREEREYYKAQYAEEHQKGGDLFKGIEKIRNTIAHLEAEVLGINRLERNISNLQSAFDKSEAIRDQQKRLIRKLKTHIRSLQNSVPDIGIPNPKKSSRLNKK